MNSITAGVVAPAGNLRDEVRPEVSGLLRRCEARCTRVLIPAHLHVEQRHSYMLKSPIVALRPDTEALCRKKLSSSTDLQDQPSRRRQSRAFRAAKLRGEEGFFGLGLEVNRHVLSGAVADYGCFCCDIHQPAVDPDIHRVHRFSPDRRTTTSCSPSTWLTDFASGQKP